LVKWLLSNIVVLFAILFCHSTSTFAIDGEADSGDVVEVEDRAIWKKGDTVEIYDPERGEYRDADVSEVHTQSNGRQEIELEDERDSETITVKTDSH
jgi:hypothetical protein